MRTAPLFKRILSENKSSSGFTLIELLIVISLITIITGAVLPSFNTYIDNQNVKQAQEQVEDDLRVLQNKALNGQEASVQLSGSNVQYWGVEFVQNDPNYTTFISVNNTTCTAGPTRQNIGVSRNLPGNSVIRSTSGCIFFSFANGDGSFNPAGSEVVIVGPESVANGCQRVTTSTSGLIVTSSDDSCT